MPKDVGRPVDRLAKHVVGLARVDGLLKSRSTYRQDAQEGLADGIRSATRFSAITTDSSQSNALRSSTDSAQTDVCL
jgi:hypothetical protein